MATVPSPAVTSSEITVFFGRITVKGPGINAWAKWVNKDKLGMSVYVEIADGVSTWTIKGLSPGLSFASYMALQATGFKASAPKP